MRRTDAVQVGPHRYFIFECDEPPIDDDGVQCNCTIDHDIHQIHLWDRTPERDKRLYLASAISHCWRQLKLPVLLPREDWMQDSHLYAGSQSPASAPPELHRRQTLE